MLLRENLSTVRKTCPRATFCPPDIETGHSGV